MNYLYSIITSLMIITMPINLNDVKSPKIIDALIQSYDAMYNGGIKSSNYNKDYIVLDMESLVWVDTTYDERQKAIKYFKKYDKTVLSASLFHLQQIGLADKLGQLKLNGVLLMVYRIYSNESKLYIEGYKWIGPIAAEKFLVTLKVENGTYKVMEIKSLGVA